MDNKENFELREELEKTQKELNDLKQESNILKKAIWDMLNYSNIYAVLLDSKMIVRLINWSLATDLGFESEKEVIGKYWLDFVPSEYKNLIKFSHKKLAFDHDKKECKEVTNDIILKDNKLVTVKWFNVPINSNYNMTFSMGLKIDCTETISSEESIRAYYRDIIQKDRTMIESLRDIAINKV